MIIYIGYIHGAYINFVGKELWRVNEDGVVRDPYQNLTYVFEMSEINFFSHYAKEKKNNTIFEHCMKVTNDLHSKIPELPFSNMWIAKETSKKISENSVLHISILNTLRSWNYFETPNSVLCFTNSGGFGIDGCLSSFIGSAKTNKDIEHYMIVGDLSFFYDVNVVFNGLPNNVHIMLINNGVGTEFKNYNHRASYFGEDANSFMAAKGHNGFKSPSLVKSICSNLGIKYMEASNKEQYLLVQEEWIKKTEKPILLEIFTSDKDESEALELMNTVDKDVNLKEVLKQTKVGKIAKKIIKGR